MAFLSSFAEFTFGRLRQRRLAEATREFQARGKSVSRCAECQLASFACICAWRPAISSQCDFILLMHRNEVFKPTNTGRLIEDVLPDNTRVFCWNRIEPEPALLELLQDERRLCVIVFPLQDSDQTAVRHSVYKSLPKDSRQLTFILLDGTWKQSGRMLHLSRWLDGIPCLVLSEGLIKRYAVRKSHDADFLSTAEAAGLCLQMAGDLRAADILFEYFQLFNLHYLATRGCYEPDIGSLHASLATLSK